MPWLSLIAAISDPTLLGTQIDMIKINEAYSVMNLFKDKLVNPMGLEDE